MKCPYCGNEMSEFVDQKSNHMAWLCGCDKRPKEEPETPKHTCGECRHRWRAWCWNTATSKSSSTVYAQTRSCEYYAPRLTDWEREVLEAVKVYWKRWDRPLENMPITLDRMRDEHLNITADFVEAIFKAGNGEKND